MKEYINAGLRYNPCCGEEDAEMDRRIAMAGFIAKQQAKMKGAPTAEYDVDTRRAYLLYPDGSRKYVD